MLPAATGAAIIGAPGAAELGAAAWVTDPAVGLATPVGTDGAAGAAPDVVGGGKYDACAGEVRPALKPRVKSRTGESAAGELVPGIAGPPSPGFPGDPFGIPGRPELGIDGIDGIPGLPEGPRPGDPIGLAGSDGNPCGVPVVCGVCGAAGPGVPGSDVSFHGLRSWGCVWSCFPVGSPVPDCGSLPSVGR